MGTQYQDRPEGIPTVHVEDSENRLEMLIFKTHEQYAVYWQEAQDSEDRDDFRWQRMPRHYNTAMAAIRAVYTVVRGWN